MKKIAILSLALAAAACGDPSPFIDGFTPPAAGDGYTRYITPTIPQIKPGEDLMVCQWIAGPSDKDREVVDVTGAQSKFGHHVVLYATASNAPVGTSRKCNDNDMLGVRFLGGMGGEGATAIKLPAGYAYKIPKGYSLLANVHYINVSPKDIQGQAVVDVKVRDPQPDSKVADIVTVIDTDLVVKPGAQSWDVNCPVKNEMTALMWGNHMHEYGTSVWSEIIRKDGTKEPLTTDDPWQRESTFNPKYRTYPSDNLLAFHPGDTVHVHCEWNNTTGNDIPFGAEMCVGFGFYVNGGSGMQVCDKGEWSEQ